MTGKVVLVTTELRMGGAEKCLVDLAIHLQDKGWRPMVVSIAPEPDQHRTLVDRLADHQVRTHYLDCTSVFGLLRATIQLARLIRKSAPTAVFSFLYHANVLTGLTMRTVRGVPYFSCIRVADPRRVRLLIERLATRNTQKYLCVSEAVSKFVINKMGVPVDRVATIPNGVDLASYPILEPQEQPVPYVIFVGRLHEQKRVVELVEWYAKAGIREKLLVVGSGHLEAQLKQLIDQQGLHHQVDLLGWVRDTLSLVQGAQCFVLPSKFEGMANALLEAMAAGKAVLAFDVEGVSELIGQSPEQIVSNGDFQQFTSQLKYLLAQPELRDRLGQENRQRVALEFQLDAQLDKYVSLLS
jgi:starch synthase (maltosyl-transferring)